MVRDSSLLLAVSVEERDCTAGVKPRSALLCEPDWLCRPLRGWAFTLSPRRRVSQLRDLTVHLLLSRPHEGAAADTMNRLGNLWRKQLQQTHYL